MPWESELETALASGVGANQLVPCDTGGFVVVADTLRALAVSLDDGGSSLSRVEVTNWRGPASEGFGSTLEVEPARWRSAADSFRLGAAALDTFVAAVGPARDLAERACAVYQEYTRKVAEAATLVGTGAGGSAVPPRLAAGGRIEMLQLARAAGADGLAMDADALRRQAIALLGLARETVEAAGDVAVESLARAADSAPDARRFWESNIRPAAIIDEGHAALDLAGFLPGVGVAPDAVNAAWYAAESNWEQAGWSAVAVVPVVGDALAASRKAFKSIEVLGNLSGAVRVAPRGPSSGPGWLFTHEFDGSHTIERHVGATRTYLASRFYGPEPIKLASTFASMNDAEALLAEALLAKHDKVQAFMANANKNRTSFVLDMGKPTGYGVQAAGGSVVTLYGLEVFLVKDPLSADGYRIWTAYPMKVG